MTSPARRGLDWLLLELCPELELVEAEWQNGGPWLLVTLGQLSEGGPPELDVFARHPFAIFKRTGAVHGMIGGAVSDDPLFVPA